MAYNASLSNGVTVLAWRCKENDGFLSQDPRDKVTGQLGSEAVKGVTGIRVRTIWA